MGNLFIGFPVPRAKIAEMIEGSAPPLEHKVNHLPDGSDPLFPADGSAAGKLLRWTGSAFEWIDSPTAGAAFPWDALNIGGTFEALDGYQLNEGGTATVTAESDGLKLSNPDAVQTLCTCFRLIPYIGGVSSWAQLTRLDAQMECSVYKDANPEFWLIKGQRQSNNQIGFFADNNGLYGITGNSTGTNIEQIASHGATKWYVYSHLSARLTPGVKCEFYLNGTKEAESTLKLPSGTANLTYAFYTTLRTSGDAKANWIKINYWNVWQGI